MTHVSSNFNPFPKKHRDSIPTDFKPSIITFIAKILLLPTMNATPFFYKHFPEKRYSSPTTFQLKQNYLFELLPCLSEVERITDKKMYRDIKPKTP